MTKNDIDNIISIICPNDEDFEKACISPAYLKKELEALALEQEPCENCISREAINELQKYRYNCGDTSIICISLNSINELPSVIPKQKIGHWIFHKPFDKGHKNCNECIECSQCHTWYGYDCYIKTPYCPNCGLRMANSEV